MSDLLAYVLIGALSLLGAQAAAPPDLRTVAEQSDYARTGRYDEVQRLCAAFAKAWPKQVRCARVRPDAGRAPDADAGGVRGRHADRGGGQGQGPAGGARAGRHPRRRDRRQGRRLPGAARAARGTRLAWRPRSRHAGLRAGVQRRRPRAREPDQSSQPDGPRGGRLARHQPEPEPQSRLREGGRPRDAGDAAPAQRVGSDRLRRPARHRRRAVRARRVAQRGADAGRATRRCGRPPSACATA